MSAATAAINNYMGYTTQRKEPSQDMDKDAFLKLLVAQLQNQDPSQSQDPALMVQQMTAFSQLEQLQNMSKLIEGLQSQNVALFQSSATALVGKHVRVQGAGVELKDGVATIGMDLTANAQVTMVIKDATGRTITTIDKGGFNSGHHEFEWNGKTSGDLPVDDGMYYVEFVATDEEGNRVGASSVSDLKVDAVAFAEGTVLIVAGGKYYSLGDIIEVKA
ncbi:MAG: flagellar hook assembly protein FlgD [Holophagales bacterium]|jgi:flagellar basal-body rod modification protein FlgD|nr:flagellar hook assembly protein FlgD [Holophagales bacterium]